MDSLRQCSRCKKEYPLKEYYFRKISSGKRIPHSYCRPCLREKWKKRNPENRKNSSLKVKHGITIKQYDEILKKQNFRCRICGEEETRKSKRRTIRALNIDHCHSSGKIRGLLCARCNCGLGNFRDDIWLLGRAMEYLTDTRRRPSLDII